MSEATNSKMQIEKWKVFEISCEGRSEGNPFTDYTITGTFSCPQEEITVDGFYDGNGIYKVRFMPSFEGRYAYCSGQLFFPYI